MGVSGTAVTVSLSRRNDTAESDSGGPLRPNFASADAARLGLSSKALALATATTSPFGVGSIGLMVMAVVASYRTGRRALQSAVRAPARTDAPTMNGNQRRR